MMKLTYQAPQLEVIETIVELGFTSSSNVEDPIEDGVEGWD